MEGQLYFMTVDYDRDSPYLRSIPDGLAHSCGYGKYYYYCHLALTSVSSLLSRLTLWQK